jgi:hypothetical protein
MVKINKNKNQFIEPDEEYFHNSRCNLSIRNSNIKFAGKGVFTEDCIPSNTFIDLYLGNICFYARCGSYFVEIDETSGINAISFPRCYMAMINDAHNSQFSNNCEIRINVGNVEVWSIQTIEQGRELFMSYGDDFWN